MAKKKKGKSDNGRNRKQNAAQRKAEELKLHKTVRTYVRKIMASSAIENAAKTFEAAAAEFRRRFGDIKECREEIVRRVNLIQPLICECGHAEFKREYGETKAKCLKCKQVKSATAHCKYFRSMREPRLKLAIIWMKERCPFFSINQFKEEFGFAYSSCWLVAKKIDMILFEHSKELTALEDMDSKLLAHCYRRRSTKTPADCEPGYEQTLADEQYYGLAQSVTVGEFKKQNKNPARVNVTHLDAPAQKVYGLISDAPIGFDKLVELSGIPVETLGGLVIRLEMNDLITPLPGDRFVLAGYAPDQNPRQTVAKQFKPLDEPSKPPKYPNASHKATADTISPLLMMSNNGFARKYCPLFVVDTWRASLIVLKEQPLQLFELCVKLGDMGKGDILQFECPNKIRIPLIA